MITSEAAGLLEAWVCAWSERMCRSLEADYPAAKVLADDCRGPPETARSTGSILETSVKRPDGVRSSRWSWQSVVNDGRRRRKPRLDPAPPPDSRSAVAALLRVEKAMQPVLQSLCGSVAGEHFSPRSSLTESSLIGSPLDTESSSASPMLQRGHTGLRQNQLSAESEARSGGNSNSKHMSAPSPRISSGGFSGSPSVPGPWVPSGSRPRSAIVPKLALGSVLRGNVAGDSQQNPNPSTQFSSVALGSPRRRTQATGPQYGRVLSDLGPGPGVTHGSSANAKRLPASLVAPLGSDNGSPPLPRHESAPLSPEKVATATAKTQRIARLADQMQRVLEKQHQVLKGTDMQLRPLANQLAHEEFVPTTLTRVDSADESSDDGSPRANGGAISVDTSRAPVGHGSDSPEG